MTIQTFREIHSLCGLGFFPALFPWACPHFWLDKAFTQCGIDYYQQSEMARVLLSPDRLTLSDRVLAFLGQ